ncbi:MAG TPA: hypothetical protein ENJ09_03120 [Planctomycetes bacterium]|nr:hypothetical protein [Planctomycetota bacterium]
MSHENRPIDRTLLRAALLGAAPVLGWLAHDAGIFVSYGWPQEALGLVPMSLVALAIGAGIGAAARGRSGVGAGIVVLAGIFWVAARQGWVGLHGARAHLPLSAFLLVLAGTVAARVPRRLGPGRLAVLLGAGAGALLNARIQRIETISWIVLGSLALWWALASLTPIRRRAWLFDMLLLLPLAWFGRRAIEFLELPRADLAVSGRGTSDAAAPHQNLVLIVLDTLRADHLATYGYGRDTMPKLDAFAREKAERFSNAYSVTSWTLPSHATLFTGRLPSEHGVTHPRTPEHVKSLLGRGFTAHPLRSNVRTIAEDLRDRGYRTGAIISNASTLRVEYGVARGYEHYDARRANFVRSSIALAQMLGAPIAIGHRPYRDAATITDLALAWLDDDDGSAPFFLTLNYMEAHLPYVPPPAYRELFEDAQPTDPLHPRDEIVSLLYDRELRYLDDELARFLEGLAERGLDRDTAIVITGDHGEGFGEHGLWKHDWSLYEEVVRVPLFVVGPGHERGSVNGTRVPATAVNTMMRRLVGLGIEEQPSEDSGMRPIAEWYTLTTIPLHADEPWTKDELDRDLLSWFEGDRKWLVGSKGRVEAYDLDVDPREENPVPLTDEERERAIGLAQAWWEAHPAPAEALGGEMQGAETNDDVLDRLRGLGYVGDE